VEGEGSDLRAAFTVALSTRVTGCLRHDRRHEDAKDTKDTLRFRRSQVLSDLKTTGLRVGLLMNFNAVMFKGNVQRIVN
jgi:hypothetical protein